METNNNVGAGSPQYFNNTVLEHIVEVFGHINHVTGSVEAFAPDILNTDENGEAVNTQTAEYKQLKRDLRSKNSYIRAVAENKLKKFTQSIAFKFDGESISYRNPNTGIIETTNTGDSGKIYFKGSNERLDEIATTFKNRTDQYIDNVEDIADDFLQDGTNLDDPNRIDTLNEIINAKQNTDEMNVSHALSEQSTTIAEDINAASVKSANLLQDASEIDNIIDRLDSVSSGLEDALDGLIDFNENNDGNIFGALVNNYIQSFQTTISNIDLDKDIMALIYDGDNVYGRRAGESSKMFDIKYARDADNDNNSNSMLKVQVLVENPRVPTNHPDRFFLSDDPEHIKKASTQGLYTIDGVSYGATGKYKSEDQRSLHDLLAGYHANNESYDSTDDHDKLFKSIEQQVDGIYEQMRVRFGDLTEADKWSDAKIEQYKGYEDEAQALDRAGNDIPQNLKNKVQEYHEYNKMIQTNRAHTKLAASELTEADKINNRHLNKEKPKARRDGSMPEEPLPPPPISATINAMIINGLGEDAMAKALEIHEDQGELIPEDPSWAVDRSQFFKNAIEVSANSDSHFANQFIEKLHTELVEVFDKLLNTPEIKEARDKFKAVSKPNPVAVEALKNNIQTWNRDLANGDNISEQITNTEAQLENPDLINTENNIREQITNTEAQLENPDLTDVERAQLEAELAALTAQSNHFAENRARLENELANLTEQINHLENIRTSLLPEAENSLKANLENAREYQEAIIEYSELLTPVFNENVFEEIEKTVMEVKLKEEDEMGFFESMEDFTETINEMADTMNNVFGSRGEDGQLERGSLKWMLLVSFILDTFEASDWDATLEESSRTIIPI